MTKILSGLTRRQALTGAAGLALYSTLPGISMAAAQRSLVPDFSDPVEALRAHVKLVGSLAKQDVVSFYRLNIYADMHDGNFVPMFTMNNLLIDQWEPKADNTFQMIKYEAGYYSSMDDYTPLTHMKHPLTGESIKIQNFLLGPVPRGYTPDKYIVMGYNPNPLPLEIIAGRVFLATQSIESSPGFADPTETRYTNSFGTYSATLEDMQNPDLASAPVHAQLQNKSAFLPWMKMGDQPGGTVVRGYGGKVAGVDDLPKGVLEGFQTHLPRILDLKTWKGFVSETIEPT